MKLFIARILPLSLAGAFLAMPAPAAADARITIVNVDGLNEGFNDPTPAAPVGGNPGTTKGQQRLIAFQFAADLWGAALDSNVDIQIQAAFNPLGPNVLGSAGATFSDANFATAAGFPGGKVDTNYHIALADKRGRSRPAGRGNRREHFLRRRRKSSRRSAAISISTSVSTTTMGRRTISSSCCCTSSGTALASRAS